MNKKITPLGKRVLVEPIRGKKAQGGILLPDNAQRPDQRGTVIRIGIGDHDFSVKPGDTILLPLYGHVEVVEDGRRMVLISEDDIIAKVDGEMKDG